VLKRWRHPRTCLKKRKKSSIDHLCLQISAIISDGTSSKLVAIRRMPSLGGPAACPWRPLSFSARKGFSRTFDDR
jgi:hypothetical protein